MIFSVPQCGSLSPGVAILVSWTSGDWFASRLGRLKTGRRRVWPVVILSIEDILAGLGEMLTFRKTSLSGRLEEPALQATIDANSDALSGIDGDDIQVAMRVFAKAYANLTAVAMRSAHCVFEQFDEGALQHACIARSAAERGKACRLHLEVRMRLSQSGLSFKARLTGPL